MAYCIFLRTWLSGRASPCQGEGRGFDSRRPLQYAPLAQLDRAFDYESKGQEFESLRARHFYFERPHICRCGGIGRRARLKIVRETVGVRVPSPAYHRDVAQLGRAPGLGPGGRMFKSCHPDMQKHHSLWSGAFLFY